MSDLIANLQRLGDTEHDDLSVAFEAIEEIVKLRLERSTLLDRLDAAEAENERLREDAERYRWLRGDSCPNHSSRWTQWEVRCWKAPSWTGDLRRADLDDAIDAARGKE